MVYSKCHCSSTFCLSMTFCSFNLGELGGHLLEKLSSRLSALAVCILCRLKCMCSFPHWFLGQEVEFDSIGS